MPATTFSSGGEVEHKVIPVSLGHLRAALTPVMCRSISMTRCFSSSSSSSKTSEKGLTTPNSSVSCCVRLSHWFILLDSPNSRNIFFPPAAVEVNAKGNGAYKNFTVYGLLTNLARFEFWSYNPNLRKFFRVGEVKAALNTRDGLLQGMMKGAPRYSAPNHTTSLMVYSQLRTRYSAFS